MEVISSDVCGPFTPTTHDGCRYFVTFIDHYSHFVAIYLMKNKSEVLEKFKQYMKYVNAKMENKIARLRCDNGGEYTSKDFKDFCAKKGIQIEYTIPYNPQQNGVAERLHRTLVEKARCLLFDAKFEKIFWGEGIKTAVYLLNRTKTRVLENKTSFQIWNDEEPNLGKV